MLNHAHAEAFAALHRTDDVLVLPNAWDSVSAKVLEQAGFPAIATASASISWTRGGPDDEGLSREEAVDAVRLIANSVNVPVSADIEKGFGGTPADVGETVKLVLEAGAVGINIEDSISNDQRSIQDMQARIAGARLAAADFPLWINARIDTYLLGQSGEAAFTDTLARADAWVQAGANSIFVPGPGQADLIEELAKSIKVPLNVLVVDENTLPVSEMKKLGVARISTGPRLMQCVWAACSAPPPPFAHMVISVA